MAELSVMERIFSMIIVVVVGAPIALFVIIGIRVYLDQKGKEIEDLFNNEKAEKQKSKKTKE